MNTLHVSPLQELLGDWLPRQRWFALKGFGEPRMSRAGQLRLADPSGRVGIEVHLIGVEAGQAKATYQVPLTYRDEPEPSLAHALLGTIEASDGSRRWIYDGPYDPVFVGAWLRLVASGGEATSDEGPDGGCALGVRQPGTAPPEVARPSRVLSAEQSNTSVIVGGDGDPDPVILKLFRVLQPGRNPDVAVTSTLTAAGCTDVPRLLGWVEGEWRDADGRRARGHLTSVSEFFADGQDAWQLACVAVQTGEDFTAEAAGLGRITAEVHAALAAALPTQQTGPRHLAELADHLRDRLDWARGAVPALEVYAAAARDAVEAVRRVEAAPPAQRIHGDLHLGQVLATGRRGWVLLDFEGEPLRPLAERNQMDLTVRDVAGMLRSFDYAARHTVLGLAGDDDRTVAATAWVAACRRAYLEGYIDGGGRDARADAVLLRALELDKALYEVVYEFRHRPDWLSIPLQAVGELLGA
jgi:trehalose synthase-fused probable maltokinase